MSRAFVKAQERSTSCGIAMTLPPGLLDREGSIVIFFRILGATVKSDSPPSAVNEGRVSATRHV